tara:strand:- start:614 stop:736 length:123 start_codon:yes stop_codon:yes gene_type:complete
MHFDKNSPKQGVEASLYLDGSLQVGYVGKGTARLALSKLR